MVKDRERYSLAVTCPVCGAAGQAEVSEDRPPYTPDPVFSVDAVSGPFDIHQARPYRLDTKLRCESCGATFGI